MNVFGYLWGSEEMVDMFPLPNTLSRGLLGILLRDIWEYLDNGVAEQYNRIYTALDGLFAYQMIFGFSCLQN